MELTQLRYFLKTAETLNYTRAAEELFTSRQALRHTLTTLEAELGKPLFRNDRNRLSLTEYGEYLKLSFGDLVNSFLTQETQVKEFFQHSSTLKIAYSVSLSPYALPGLEHFVLRELSQKFPHNELQIFSRTTDEVIRLLEAEEIDLGCIFQVPTPRPDWNAVVIRSSPFIISFGEQSPFFGKKSITLEELSAVPLVGMGSLDKIAQPIDEECKQKHITLNYRVVPNSIDALYLMNHNQAACFDVAPPNWSGEPPMTVLEHYTWEIVALCPKNRPNHPAARLLAEFLAEKYREN